MRDVRIGKSDNMEVGVVTYYLSDSKDIFRVVNQISKALEGVKMIDIPGYVFRYDRGDEVGEILVVASFGETETGKRKADVISAGKFEEVTLDIIDKVSEELGLELEFIELSNGFYAVDVDKYVKENSEVLSKLSENFLNSKSDIWLNMGEDIGRVGWKPDYLDGRYVFAQALIPYSEDKDAVNTIKDVVVTIS